MCKTTYSKPPIELGKLNTIHFYYDKYFNLSGINSYNRAINFLKGRGFKYEDAEMFVKKAKLLKGTAKGTKETHQFEMGMDASEYCKRSSVYRTIVAKALPPKTTSGLSHIYVYEIRTTLPVVSKLVKKTKKKFLGLITYKTKTVNEWRPLIASELDQVFNKAENDNQKIYNSWLVQSGLI